MHIIRVCEVPRYQLFHSDRQTESELHTLVVARLGQILWVALPSNNICSLHSDY